MQRYLPVLLALCTLSAFASEKRPLTHEDLWLMQRVGSPSVSPDGRHVVFSVTEPAYDAKEQSSDLWIVPVDGSAPPRKITQTKGGESGAEWSPDSQRLVFSARREGNEAGQLYVLSLAAGGEAQRLTNLTLGARSPKWSPDGTQVLFISDVYPEATDETAIMRASKERKDRKYNVRRYDGFPIRHWDRWLDDKQARLIVQAATPHATPRDLLSGTTLAAMPGFSGAITNSGETFTAEWTPDGQAVLFAATNWRHTSAYALVKNDLYLVSPAGGEPQRLTANDDNYGAIAFSPEGKSLVVSVTIGESGRVYALPRLAHYPWPFAAEQRRILTADFDRSPTRPVFSPDSKRIYFTAEDAGFEKVYTVRLAAGTVSLVRDPGVGVITGISAGTAPENFRLVGLWESASSPPEVYAYDPTDGEARRLTNFTGVRSAALDLPPLGHFTFTSRGGREIHNLLVRPGRVQS